MPFTRQTARMAALEGITDPVSTLGPHVAHLIASFLTPQELALASCVSKSWRAASDDDRLWKHHTNELWSTKAYVPPKYKDAISDYKAAYVGSIKDSKRTHITAEELTGFVWTFRFKAVAGTFLQLLDPYWTGDGEPMQRHFHADGSLTAPSGDRVWGENEVRWRFTRSQRGKKGLYVQVNQWPSLDIIRTEDWGWGMSNQWVLYRALLPDGCTDARSLLHGADSYLDTDDSDDSSYQGDGEDEEEEEEEAVDQA